MAINKKLISFATQAQFDVKLNAGDIDNRSIVFIEDKKRIWTHGVFFDTSWDFVTGKPKTLDGYGITDAAKKINSLYYVEGNTTGTAGAWTGSIPEVTSLYAGLTIAYKIGVAGASTTNLNLNGLGNKLVRRATGNLTTHLPVGTIVLLTYDGTRWVWADYDSNTTYAAMPVAEGKAGTAGTLRTMRADYLKQIVEHHITNTVPSAHTLGSHSDVTITSNSNGEILRWNGSKWINNTLAEAGIAAASQLNNYLPLAGGTISGSINYNNTSGTNPMMVMNRASGGGAALARLNITGYDKGLGLSNQGDLIFGDWSSVATLSSSWNKIWHSGNFATGNTSQYIRGDGSLATYTTYSTMSATEILAGKATTARTITSKVLNDWLNGKNYATVGYVDNLEIGGRNLLLDKDSTPAKTNGISKLSGSTSWVMIYPRHQAIIVGKQYVISFKCRKLSGTVLNLSGHTSPHSTSQFFLDNNAMSGTYWSSGFTYPNDEETHQVHILVTFANNTSPFYIQPNRGNSYSYEFAMDIWDIQIEKGNKATDWTPAPEDQVSDWNTTDATSFSFIKNKPTTYTPSAHSHGPITNDGKIGTLTNRIIETTTGGLLTHVAKKTAYNKDFGTGTDQVARGNHTHAYLPLTGGTITGALTIKSSANAGKDVLLTLGRSSAGYGDTQFSQSYDNRYYSNGKTLDIDLHNTTYLSLAGSNNTATGKIIAHKPIEYLTGTSDNWNTAYTYSQVGHLPLSGGTLTGNLEIFAANTDKFIKFAYNTTDAYAWRIGYLGTGAGNENRLTFQSAKTSGASYVDALSFGLDDLVGRFAVTPTVGNTKVSLEGHTHNYDNYSSWTLEALNSANSSLGTAAVESGKTAQIKAGSGITLSMSGSQIVITNASPDQNHNTDEKVRYTLATDNQEYRMLMSQYYSTPPTILGVKYTDDIRINPHLARISATTFKGALDGKASTAGAADTATALTTKNVGSLSQPVFFDSEGKPKVLSRSFSTSATAYTYAERNSNGDLYARRFYGNLFGNSTSSNILNRRGDDRRGFTPTNVSGGTALFTFSTQGAMNNQINDSDYSDVFAINSYLDSSAGRVNALSFDKSSYRINHFMGNFGADSWLGFKTLAYTSDLVDTWNANTRTVDGYVTKGLNQANKVWKTDANGNPAWRNDENTIYSHPTTAGNKHIPSGGASGQILRWSSNGTAVWSNENTGSSYTHPTGDGNLHVPKTGTTNNGRVLKAGATAGSISWGTLADIGAAPASHTHSASDITGITSRSLLGRYSTTTGAAQMISIGGGLTLSDSGVLSTIVATIGSTKTSGRLVVGSANSSINNLGVSHTDINVSNGSLYATAFYESSDEKLKIFKQDIKVNFDKLKQIPKKYFTWKDDLNSLDLGTSAQEIQKIYPELVSKNNDGTLTVNYAKLSIIALAAIDELNNEIQKLKNE